jgi:hypothetical protein
LPQLNKKTNTISAKNVNLAQDKIQKQIARIFPINHAAYSSKGRKPH